MYKILETQSSEELFLEWSIRYKNGTTNMKLITEF